jgi:hypothetical protein
VSNAILPALRPAELDGQELRPLDFGAFAWRRKAAGSWFVMATQSAQFDPRVPSSDWLTHVAYELDEGIDTRGDFVGASGERLVSFPVGNIQKSLLRTFLVTTQVVLDSSRKAQRFGEV